MKSVSSFETAAATAAAAAADVAATAAVATSHHCHCPSNRGPFEDPVASSIPMPMTMPCCNLCERLGGWTVGDSNGADAARTKAARVAVESSPTVRKLLHRTLRRDRISLGESSARCASSVVRWSFVWGMKGESIGWRRFVLRTVVLFTIAIFGLAAAQQDTAVDSYYGEGVCHSVEVRNSVDELTKLEGCRVIEGFVHIVLIDRVEESAYVNITFPDLVEITGYLLLYRVSGLKSIGQLFPNLAVIRGDHLFVKYALVAFDMMHLQEIGLHSLTNIQHGSVRFEENPMLCYVHTIDWDVINQDGGHIVLGNKLPNECPVCDKNCPTRQDSDETLCWNYRYCQRICDDVCEEDTCNDRGECCHPSCLGGCTGPTAKDCIVCKDVMTTDNECKDRCPNGTYEFMNRRCIHEQECRSMLKPRDAVDIVRDYPYKLFNGSCVVECPTGYMDENFGNNSHSCKKCEDLTKCLKECRGANVDSITAMQKLRGCTHVRGNLRIELHGRKNIAKELEENLSMIEEIDGYLKIVRSSSLISLNFLRNLRVIHGNWLDTGNYSLTVIDNENLQELWDWSTHQDISIFSADGPAKVFFHYNPKLCLHKIETLRKKAKLSDFSDLEVALNTNGDRVPCNVTELETKVIKKTPRGAIIEWEAFTHHDSRSLLGYVVYFVEAPYRNLTIYDSYDTCGGNNWRVEDVSAESAIRKSNNGTDSYTPVYITHILTLLKPYTQYAYYVKTYTIATERSGAQSKLNYFMTPPDAPSSPRALSTWSDSSTEVVVSWLPPIHKNGNLTYYRIISRWQPDDPHFYGRIDYCNEPEWLVGRKPTAVVAEEGRKRAEEEKELAKSLETSSCDCADPEADQSMHEQEVSGSIAFENALHNQVYIKRRNARTKRDVSEILNTSEVIADFDNDQDKEGNVEKLENGTYVILETLVPSANLTYVIRDLQHFAAYTIEVQACRERFGNESRKKNCSTKSVKTYRTLAMETADDIPSDTLRLSISRENNSFTTVILYWNEPSKPNGLILAYQVQYERVDVRNAQITIMCVTRPEFIKAGHSYLLKDLSAGNYSVKVRATSLAGHGVYTEAKYFFIEDYSTLDRFWIIFWSILCITVALSSFGTFYVCKRKLVQNIPLDMRLYATVNPEYVSPSYMPDEWEVPRTKIELLRELGNGSFGMVYEGVARDVVKGKPEVRCAVKTVNEKASDRERIEFLNEASVMKAFNTYHVVKLLGVVSQGQPTLVVMELMVNGDLKTYLRSLRPDGSGSFPKQPPTLKRILQMAIEIADGMAYLAAKKFVHRDLAARNCMVAEDLTVKIGDFGMTRDIYETDYYRKGTKGLLPVRWMAPESLKDGVFSCHTDVWSYGVVLWEMVTLATQPYQGLSNDQVLRYVIDGGVMERPENCPDSLYDLMRRTWTHRPSKRPTFIDIATVLLQEVTIEDFEKISFYHSPAGIEARNLNSSHSSETDKDLKSNTVQNTRDEEIEGEEDSPLRQDFDDFASCEPTSIKNNLSPRYGIDPYGENSKINSNFHDMNLSNIPLKAGFEDFDGISGDSLASSKETLNLPFVEDSLKSVKSSPFIRKKTRSRGNVSQSSLGKSAGSPQCLGKQDFLNSPNSSRSRNNSSYETKSPQIILGLKKKENNPLQIDFPSMDAIDIDFDSDKNGSRHTDEYTNKLETLSNGYIGNTTT